ncbi:MAG TPA: hypothetical protein VIL69_20330 [Roseomonas sp.]
MSGTRECESFIGPVPPFPARVVNRAALPRIAYRVATYGEFRAALLRGLDRAVELRGWTHRAPDDPGIALLEGAAIIGDILTFYQERYANEAYLRTAGWRESVAELVRLLGYRLAPGIGGRATFAIEVKGSAPVGIPTGLPLKLDLAASPDPAEFQTAAPLTAWPHLSRFHLYRARSYGKILPAGANQVEIALPLARAQSLGLKAGDRLMLVPPPPGWINGSTFGAAQKAPQTVKVKAVTHSLDRTLVELEAPLAESWTLPVTAWRLGRSFRHFGHTAPGKTVQNTKSGGKIDGATERATNFLRHTDDDHSCSMTDCSLNLPGTLMPLDGEVQDLVVGGRVILRAEIREGSSGAPVSLTMLRSIAALRSASIGFASLTGPSTLMTLGAPLTRENGNLQADLRDIQILEVTSPAIPLRPMAGFSSAAFASGAKALSFYGTSAEAQAMTGRPMLLQRNSEAPLALTCTSTAAEFTLPAGIPDVARMWPLSFDRAPSPFTSADFDEAAPGVTVFGNLVEATQGKAEPVATLGNGDARAPFQTFKLPKAPLTYLPDAGATPPQAPELAVHVAGHEWQRVESLFGQEPQAEVYIVREDAEGNSYVQFGDGKTGARLPSGIGNVTANFRTGVGAFGAAKPGATPSAGQRIEGVDKVRLPGIVTGGQAPEAADLARSAAPGKIQGLGRLVSLRDFETEALLLPGITTASAVWALEDGMPALILHVLLEAGREAEFSAAGATLRGWGKERGADRFAVAVRQAWLRYAFLDLTYAADPRLRAAEVEAAVRRALGPTDDPAAASSGLFGLRARRLGGKEYASRVEAVVQGVAGILWCRVTGFGLFKPRVTDPLTLPLPIAPRPRAALLSTAADELLQLHPSHLTLTAGAAA